MNVHFDTDWLEDDPEFKQLLRELAQAKQAFCAYVNRMADLRLTPTGQKNDEK